MLALMSVLGEDLPPTCSDRLWGSKPLSIGVVWQFFYFIASIYNTIGPSYILCGRRRGR